MLLHDDLMYQILLWLPVISLLRFKRVCRSWRALIENCYFIKQHLLLHHYDPSLKDKNHTLIRLFTSNDSALTLRVISIDSFEKPNTCARLDCSDLPVEVRDIVSYHGIICLNLFKFERGHSICLWNPVTKQSRDILQLPFLHDVFTTVGFGFDVRNNDYKVVNLIRRGYHVENGVDVYSLNTNSWRSLTIGFPFVGLVRNPRMPFNNGTCFFWLGYDSHRNEGIFCFDFSSEMFHSISFPHADGGPLFDYPSVVSDKIACILKRNDCQLEIWVLNEYGRVNESWAKLYTTDPYSTINWLMFMELVSMNGNYIFFRGMVKMCRFNVATKETKNLPTALFKSSSYRMPWVEFKESLVSLGEGNSAPNGVYKDSGKVVKVFTRIVVKVFQAFTICILYSYLLSSVIMDYD